MIRVVHLTLPSNSTSVLFPPQTADQTDRVFLTHRGLDEESKGRLQRENIDKCKYELVQEGVGGLSAF